MNLGSRKKAKLLTHTGKIACQAVMLGRKGGAQKEILVSSLLGTLRAYGKWMLKWKNHIRAFKAARVTTAKM